MVNKVYAVKKFNRRKKIHEWWAVVDCGESKVGGMTIGTFQPTYFKKDGRTYRWIDELFSPPKDLEEWQEIVTLEKMVTVVNCEGNSFEGWEDKEDLAYTTLQNFAKLLGHNLTIDEIKKLIGND